MRSGRVFAGAATPGIRQFLQGGRAQGEGNPDPVHEQYALHRPLQRQMFAPRMLHNLGHGARSAQGLAPRLAAVRAGFQETAGFRFPSAHVVVVIEGAIYRVQGRFGMLQGQTGRNLYPYTTCPSAPSARSLRVTISTRMPMDTSSASTSVNCAVSIGPSSNWMSAIV